jgi:4-hydroxy-2-oxoheptanedioate aldolase
MRKLNRTRQKLLRGEAAFGYSLASGSVVVAESLSHSGIDWIMVDNQHGSWGQESTMLALMAINSGSATPFARVARNDYTMVGRLLDEGAMGIIVPNVDNREAAKAAAGACRFPPRGGRSWGWGRARNLGEDYSSWVNEETFLAVQIESPEAVRNAEEILAVDGVDACWVGPFDLAISMGLTPGKQSDSHEHAMALEHVLAACRNTGKVPGISCRSAAVAKHHVAQGFRFVTAGGDLVMLLEKAADGVRSLYPEPATAPPANQSASGY